MDGVAGMNHRDVCYGCLKFAVGDSDNNLHTTFFADLYILAKAYLE